MKKLSTALKHRLVHLAPGSYSLCILCMEVYAHTHSDIYTINMRMYIYICPYIYIKQLFGIYLLHMGGIFMCCTLSEVLKCLNLALLMRFLEAA